MGHGAYICLAAKYDANAIIPLLMTMFEVLNLVCSRSCWTIVRFGDSIEEDNNIFGVGASMEESSRALVVGKLSLFKRFIIPTTCVDPLTCWQIHETLFPNVSFLAKQILGISRS